MSDWYILNHHIIDIICDHNFYIYQIMEGGDILHFYDEFIHGHMEIAYAIKENMKINQHIMELDSSWYICTNNSRLFFYSCYNEISAGFMMLKYPYLKFNLLPEQHVKDLVLNSDLLTHPYERLA